MQSISIVPVVTLNRCKNVSKKCNKNPKLQLCRQHVPLEALYLVVGGLIVPPKGNAVCTAVNFGFFVMPSSL